MPRWYPSLIEYLVLLVLFVPLVMSLFFKGAIYICEQWEGPPYTWIGISAGIIQQGPYCVDFRAGTAEEEYYRTGRWNAFFELIQNRTNIRNGYYEAMMQKELTEKEAKVLREVQRLEHAAKKDMCVFDKHAPIWALSMDNAWEFEMRGQRYANTPMPENWQELRASKGRMYYYNNVTGIRQWKRPKRLQDISEEIEARHDRNLWYGTLDSSFQTVAPLCCFERNGKLECEAFPEPNHTIKRLQISKAFWRMLQFADMGPHFEETVGVWYSIALVLECIWILALVLYPDMFRSFVLGVTQSSHPMNTRDLKYLLHYGLSVDMCIGTYSLLMHAVNWDNLEGVKLLLQFGADPNASVTGYAGWSIFMLSVRRLPTAVGWGAQSVARVDTARKILDLLLTGGMIIPTPLDWSQQVIAPNLEICFIVNTIINKRTDQMRLLEQFFTGLIPGSHGLELFLGYEWEKGLKCAVTSEDLEAVRKLGALASY